MFHSAQYSMMNDPAITTAMESLDRRIDILLVGPFGTNHQ